MHIPVLGINVSRTKQAQEVLVYGLVQETAERVGLRTAFPREAVVCFGDYVGPGYSLPTPGMVEALLIELMRKGYFEWGSNILFVHTGGLPISAYL